MRDIHELFKEAYEKANLEETSQYSDCCREELGFCCKVLNKE